MDCGVVVVVMVNMMKEGNEVMMVLNMRACECGEVGLECDGGGLGKV